MDQDNNEYDQSAAQDAGRAAGRAGQSIRELLCPAHLKRNTDPPRRGDYNDARQDVNRDEQSVENIPGDVGRDAEQGFNSAEQDVENAPSDVG
ncbi:hypothetical protein LTR53_002904 [Teratosphaeriaceae sp. CCFEE 6253]|nr:hypothetical protein LTR53_002904 [Teratosphaeriaceae sp. CCFEE 6253]